MNGCSRTVRVTLRTSRTMRGISGTVMAMTTFCSDEPKIATMAMAKSTPGIAISPSISRMAMRSVQAEKQVTMPKVTPISVVAAATAKPTISELRVP